MQKPGATIILISDADGQINEIADVVISTSTTHDLLTPITNSIPLQLLAYNLGIAKGTNVVREILQNRLPWFDYLLGFHDL